MSYLSSDKAESELAQSIKKATSPEETAPKQKHVRNCIVYTWDHRTSAIIWNILKVQPILSDEVQTFKALITVHNIIKNGHPNVIKDALRETGWLEACGRSVNGDGVRGYGTLIRNYVDLLLHKLQYHRDHPEFNGEFDYEEYISLKNVDDPNEGFETINDLMTLQDRIDRFQKVVFASFRHYTNNECRIASLVPLVEESHGIYKFITSMLRAMHRRLDAMDALAPLRQKFNVQHYNLLKFYYECSSLKYLTNLKDVPKLPADPPSLFDVDTPKLPKRPSTAQDEPTPPPAQPSPEPVIDYWSQQQAQQQREYEDEQKRLAQQRADEEERMRQQQMQQQREFEEQQRLMAERARQQQEELMRQQMQNHQAGRINELEMQLLNYRNQLERDQMMLEQYDRRVKALEQELSMVNSNAQLRDQSKDELIRSLQNEIQMWKNKYEALAKLYSQLRKEHIDLLNKYKQLQVKANSAQEALDKVERMQADMRAKNIELADLIRERDRARNELARVHENQRDEMDRLRRELSQAQQQMADSEKGKRDEFGALVTRLRQQKEDLESTLLEKQALIDEFIRQLEDMEGNADKVRAEKDEEIAVLQAGMDECLQQLADLQQNDKQRDLQDQLEHLETEHTAKLSQILDSILTTCIQKINDGMYELETPGQHGNENATPELTLSMIERASISSVEFLSAFSKFMDGSNTGDHASTIACALGLADTMIDVLLHAKGITRLIIEDEDIDEMIKLARQSAESTIQYFSSVMSTYLQMLPRAQRPEVIIQGDMRVQDALTKLSQKTEDLIVSAATDINKLAEGEVGDLVEQEMSNAARAIEEATAKIQELMRKPANPEFSATDLQVHQLILNSVLALTNAIANLIKCATASQQEIVAQGRGTSSKAAFYKKHNRWTEGLISAAKAVAVATNLLVEAADGVITKTHSLEQLIVASNEVSAATAQLVAASRVKSTFMSRTQERLEIAAKAVKDAANELVKQVKNLVSQKADNDDLHIDFNKLSVHEFKRREMEQQVKILKLDAELTNARRILAEMRRSGYHTEETD
ncbi:ANTH domain-containing protein [Radiomyces spectabilis]|uniref:ANTH domain-containing protein n=1 Tax=Radiomyces spectabilis TaxID=64574 RepID=UPI00222058B1|nr:ANTH domain-containing protein [Radiomyces spectabilis]KAI8374188.1 ANTH domain-containing protein [Radiomyces spectabilis]